MPESADIVIAGGGPVGLALARALEQFGVRATLVSTSTTASDRPIALSHASRILLERMGAWRGLNATPIRTIHVSQRGGFGRTLIDHRDYKLPALGHVIAYSDLLPALGRTLDRKTMNGTVTGSEAEAGQITVRVTSDPDSGQAIQHLRTRLLVIAEGTLPAIDATSAGATPVRQRDYHQSALVASVKTDNSSEGRAWERFTEDGPIALLPYRDRYALVWSLQPDDAHTLAALPDHEFLARLGTAFGRRAGAFIEAGERGVFPLQLRVRDPAPVPQVLTIGNAAQTLHPVAGQGLNLGLRDAWELAELAGSWPRDEIGGAGFVEHYLRRRRLDRLGSVRATDLFVRMFSTDDPFARCARGFGLFALDVLPPAREFLARRMMFGARALP